jgi:hypothetical protein
MCKELIGCDLSIPEGRNKAIQENLFIKICPKIVKNAAEILKQFLRE